MREVESDFENERSREGTGEKKCPLCKEEENAIHTHLKCSEIQK